jgi:hypothetical protein
VSSTDAEKPILESLQFRKPLRHPARKISCSFDTFDLLPSLDRIWLNDLGELRLVRVAPARTLLHDDCALSDLIPQKVEVLENSRLSDPHRFCVGGEFFKAQFPRRSAL